MQEKEDSFAILLAVLFVALMAPRSSVVLSPQSVLCYLFDGIELLKKVEFGGMKQYPLLRDGDCSKAVLLWLHADPSKPTILLA